MEVKEALNIQREIDCIKEKIKGFDVLESGKNPNYMGDMSDKVSEICKEIINLAETEKNKYKEDITFIASNIKKICKEIEKHKGVAQRKINSSDKKKIASIAYSKSKKD